MYTGAHRPRRCWIPVAGVTGDYKWTTRVLGTALGCSGRAASIRRKETQICAINFNIHLQHL